jgi:hypothetical protein
MLLYISLSMFHPINGLDIPINYETTLLTANVSGQLGSKRHAKGVSAIECTAIFFSTISLILTISFYNKLSYTSRLIIEILTSWNTTILFD